MGTGKTFTAINAAKRLHLPILAITPASLRGNFKKELEATGTTGSQVMSYQEALKRINNPAFTDLARKSLVVMDEAHNLGGDSDRSRLTSLLPGKKLLLTGTPIRNKPHEIAPLINAASPGSLPENESEFNNKFVATREVPVGFWGRLRGVKPGVIHVPTNLDTFAKAIHGKVDFHENVDRSNFPSFSESIINVPMTSKQQAAYDYSIGKYPTMAYKVRHGIPPSKEESKNLTAFFNGPRQISNHPGEFNTSATDDDAPKFKAAADQIQQRLNKDKNFRGVVYSNFLEAGMSPMSRELDRRGIKHTIFNGEMNDKEKKQAVEDYNKGHVPVLLISSAGSEGLDLKGTKYMALVEPHWNEEKINQVRGRAIRYKSHTHLPEEERHVEVQRFHAVPTYGFFKGLGIPTQHHGGVDQYLYEMAKEKRDLNSPFLEVLRREGGDGKKAAEAEDPESILWVEFKEAAMSLPIMSQLFPGDKSRRYDYSHELRDLHMMRHQPEIDAQRKAQEMEQKAKDREVELAAKAEQKAKEDAIKRQQKAEDHALDRAMKLHEKELDRAADAAAKEQERAQERQIRIQEQAEERAFEAVQKAEERKDQILQEEAASAQAEVDAARAAAAAATDALHRVQTGTTAPSVPPESPESAPAGTSAVPKKKTPGKKASFPAMAATKESEWTSPANLAVHADKHGDEFGGAENYVALERQLSMQAPADATVLNKRCQAPGTNQRTRCSTAYLIPSLGVVHVRDDQNNKTISLYKRRSASVPPMNAMGSSNEDRPTPHGMPISFDPSADVQVP
jgi:superfamily II DNA/RNA helicase